MSDNSADSLRRELEAALTERFAAFSRSDMCFHSVFTDGCLGCFTREAMWAVEPVVAAALEAARADERERLQQENQQLRERLEAIRRDPTLALVTNVKPFKVVFEDGN